MAITTPTVASTTVTAMARGTFKPGVEAVEESLDEIPSKLSIPVAKKSINELWLGFDEGVFYGCEG
eukprot:CAMPEP_0170497752 /NCGR_PEP_ID=MMETSP0208-20121228/25720_1 /TAXON_ID=197538 /ORGANISM="Strombidium inclinatum, Strain S3" /LENGTH=65 /DNA_ID=CAMNT_0010774677 /DNA_START=40 /DNA_END=237 /DNA_ORIENTATION=-